MTFIKFDPVYLPSIHADKNLYLLINLQPHNNLVKNSEMYVFFCSSPVDWWSRFDSLFTKTFIFYRCGEGVITLRTRKLKLWKAHDIVLDFYLKLTNYLIDFKKLKKVQIIFFIVNKFLILFPANKSSIKFCQKY